LSLMSVTLTQGVKKAYWFMSGNTLSDMTIAVLAYNGIIMRWGKGSLGWDIIALLGSCVFIGYGVYLFTKRETSKDIAVDIKTTTWRVSNIPVLIKWYVINLLNPSIFIFWITILTQFSKRHHNASNIDIKIFIISVLVTFLVTDVIKINSADWLLGKLTIKNMKAIHTVAWVLLALAWAFIAIRTVLQH
jgi:threonine/homoserine/homoserine lactone efflux protein